MVVGWEERRQLVKVANLYYIDGWTQEQIARKAGQLFQNFCKRLKIIKL